MKKVINISFTIIRNIFKVVGKFLLGVSILIFLIIGYGTVTGNYRLVPILTNSMAPVMPKGSLALVEKGDEKDLEVGDIIVFVDPTTAHNTICHRIHEITYKGKTAYYRTKGDNNTSVDTWNFKYGGKDVFVVNHSVPKIGSGIISIKDHVSKNSMLIIGVSLIFISFIRLVWAERKKKKSINYAQ